MGWTIRVQGFDSWQGLGIFLFTTMSRKALGPTQPPIQWVVEALSLAGVKNAWSYTSTPPVCLHGMMLSIGVTLLLPLPLLLEVGLFVCVFVGWTEILYMLSINYFHVCAPSIQGYFKRKMLEINVSKMLRMCLIYLRKCFLFLNLKYL
jgi:hypothetical protein